MDSGSGSLPPVSEKSLSGIFLDPAARVGSTLARRYAVERLLGVGAMGAVYAVRHLQTEGRLAAKILSPQHLSDPTVYQRFRDEARIVAQLRHPHIVQVTDFDLDEDGTPFMVMEMLEGETLEARLARDGRLPLQDALALAAQVGEALHAAHTAGVVHRDIKPDNIFLVRHAGPKDTEIAKVLDFGISKIVRSLRKRTQENTILGTPLFMSPEAATGSVEEIDGRADQFALAVILYQMLSGRLPFDGINDMAVLFQIIHAQPPSLEQLVPGLPRHVVAAIERALGKDKSERFPSILEFIDALRAPATQVLQRPGPPSKPDLAERPDLPVGPPSQPGLALAAPPPPQLSAQTPAAGPAREETAEIVSGATSELAAVETKALPLITEGATPLLGTDLPQRRPLRKRALLLLLLALALAALGGALLRGRLQQAAPAPAGGTPTPAGGAPTPATRIEPLPAPSATPPAAPPPRVKPRPPRSKPAPPPPRLQLDTAL
jgi:serine/threonine-protein kinase